jgi:hypothetical protein
VSFEYPDPKLWGCGEMLPAHSGVGNLVTMRERACSRCHKAFDKDFHPQLCPECYETRGKRPEEAA